MCEANREQSWVEPAHVQAHVGLTRGLVPPTCGPVQLQLTFSGLGLSELVLNLSKLPVQFVESK